MSRLTIEQKRRHREATSAAMKRRAKALQCRKCSRLNALMRIKNSLGIVEVVVCRYCKHERPGIAYTDASLIPNGEK